MLLVIYLKAIIKDKAKPTGSKFLCLLLLNSLMRTSNKHLLIAIEKKLIRRLYILGSQKDHGILEFSNANLKDRGAGKMFHQLLR